MSTLSEFLRQRLANDDEFFCDGSLSSMAESAWQPRGAFARNTEIDAALVECVEALERIRESGELHHEGTVVLDCAGEIAQKALTRLRAAVGEE